MSRALDTERLGVLRPLARGWPVAVLHYELLPHFVKLPRTECKLPVREAGRPRGPTHAVLGEEFQIGHIYLGKPALLVASCQNNLKGINSLNDIFTFSKYISACSEWRCFPAPSNL